MSRSFQRSGGSGVSKSVPGVRNRQGVGMSGGHQWRVTRTAGEASWKQRGTGKHATAVTECCPGCVKVKGKTIRTKFIL